jgi:hypothetical protein
MSDTKQPEEQESAWLSTLKSIYNAAGKFVRREEESIWKNLSASFREEFAPVGAAGAFLMTGIVRATWRLRACNNAEATDPALDPMEATAETLRGVDRARGLVERSVKRSIAELRRIRTELQLRNESFRKGKILSKCRIAGLRKILPAIRLKVRAVPFKAEITRYRKAAKQSEAGLKAAPESKGDGDMARNAPCPCGSGRNHKDCCGIDFPPFPGDFERRRAQQ